MVGERRVILLTVDERKSSDKVLDWAVTQLYRVSALAEAQANTQESLLGACCKQALLVQHMVDLPCQLVRRG